ncbi:MAG: Asp-tRNA(Asn)/Glu-tRNA(Gln) amidotransferase subunit GatA [Pseudomonadota bacterium]
MTAPTIKQLHQALVQGQFSARELAQHYLSGIESHEDLNSFISVDTESALARAQAADELFANNSANLLTGIPLGMKDIFCAQGTTTTCASNMLRHFVAPYDATVVEQLNDQQTVTLGKTNMDEFAMGSSNENSAFGAVKNPWDTTCVPGGSSGGSAAAVAAGLVPVATGTDTGGSIRQPAAFCGITGLKPTYGRVSRYGMVAFASSLDQGGAFARHAEDAGLLFAAMSGFDPRDSTSAQREDTWVKDLMNGGLATLDTSLTIGLPKEYFAASMESGIGEALDGLAKQLEQAGHTLIEVSLPHTEAAVAAYYVIAGAEASTNLSRYDGVRFGHRCENPTSLEDLYTRSRSEGFGEEVKRRILTGTYALSVGYFDAYYLKAQKIRRLISSDFMAAFDNADVLLTPTTPAPAFKLGSLTKDPVAMYAQDVFTVPTSLAGLPALSMPCGQVGGMPVGAQLIGQPFREDVLLGLANQYQAMSDWHLQLPGTVHPGPAGVTS